MDNKFEVIVSIINTGFSNEVMNAARENGARGGTILHGRGSGKKHMEEKLGFVITPEKEMILIVVNVDIRDAVISAINKIAGASTPAHGIIFSLPISNTSGLKFD